MPRRRSEPESPKPAARSATLPPGLPDTPCVIRAWVNASSLSARYYGLPVYLVGGALKDPDPRDIDLVIVIPTALFCAMYDGTIDEYQLSLTSANPYPIWMRWARDCAKQSLQLTHKCQRAVDFKTMHTSLGKHFDGLPKIRLDCGIRVPLDKLT